ncbi:hypothetical protein HIM_00400 [Hirsutella minnesotensis 3608]|nr:hypothetical protein HIM_00400 [Hirsutella minnesotensis 3608]
MVVEETGELRYFGVHDEDVLQDDDADWRKGPSSTISILSPDGLQWLESRTADASLLRHLGGSWAKWTHPKLQSLWPTTVSTPLPCWEDASALVNDFFESYNTAMPIYHPPIFMDLLGRQYAHSVTAVDDPAWSVALHSVLALALRKRAEQNPQDPELMDRSWAYAKSSLEALLAVLMHSPSLLSVQALLTLAWFFHGTPNPQPFFFLSAAAVRLSYSAGMHRVAENLPVTSTDREQRLRVFWVALIFDSSASLATGRPFTHNIDDIGIPLPPASPKDNLGITVNRGGTAVLNLLLAKSKLALLQGKVYGRLFTASASQKSMEVLATDSRDLGMELEEWSRALPGSTDCSKGIDEWCHQQPYIISLLLSYHSCVITVHSATWQRHFASLSGKSTQQDPSLTVVGFPQAEKCLHAAHEIINLLRLVPGKNTSFIWEIMHRPVQAMMLFFICILQQPDHANVEAHLRAISEAITFMSMPTSDQEGTFIQPILAIAHEIFRIARAATQWGKARAGSVEVSAGKADGRRSTVIGRSSPLFQPSLVPNLANSVPTTSSVPQDGSACPPSAARPGQRPGDVPLDGSLPPELWDAEQKLLGVEGLYNLPIPFLWDWQDLSSGLLENFNFDFG